MSTHFTPATPQSFKAPCIILVGMPGVGKSTIGALLAKSLQWVFVDSDYIIESIYAVPLQSVTDAMSKEEFLDVEMHVITSLRMFRTVLATGGSVVYREQAMRHLQTLGPVVYLHAPLELIVERVSHNPQRGIAIAPGQTLEDLFNERARLYTKYAHCTVNTEGLSPDTCAAAVLATLQKAQLIL